MINRRVFLLGSALTLLSPIPANARTIPRTLSYGRAKLDIYAPFGVRNAPVVVFVHGGGWTIGNRRSVYQLPEFFNALGIIFVSIDHRKIPFSNVPFQKEDVALAINWVRKNIARYGANPKRIGVAGFSSGAHLASLAILDGSAGKVSALISLDTGAYDIQKLSDAYHGKLPLMFSNAFRKKKLWRSLSPAHFIDQRNAPATFIAWSNVKHNAQLSKNFANDLSAHAVNVTTFDGSHIYSHRKLMRAIGKSQNQLTKALTKFVTENL